MLDTLITISASARWAAPENQSIAYRRLESHLIVYPADAAHEFVLRRTSTAEIRVDATSAGTLTTAETQPATAVNPESQQHWTAGQYASLGRNPSSQTLRFQPGQFGFLSRGSTLTYRQTSTLGTDSDSIVSMIKQHLAPVTSGPPSTSDVLREAGVLLATAPLRPAGRAALWRAVFGLSGVHECGERTDLAGRRGVSLCSAKGVLATAIVIDPASGAVLAVQQSLATADPNYPTMQAGDLVQDDTYLPVDSQGPCDSHC